MVGGTVINIVRMESDVWVGCIDATYEQTMCAIRVKDSREMKVGDKLWWQGKRALWTPKPYDGREDIVLERVGYSHSKIPDDVMEKALGGDI